MPFSLADSAISVLETIEWYRLRGSASFEVVEAFVFVLVRGFPLDVGRPGKVTEVRRSVGRPGRGGDDAGGDSEPFEAEEDGGVSSGFCVVRGNGRSKPATCLSSAKRGGDGFADASMEWIV